MKTALTINEAIAEGFKFFSTEENEEGWLGKLSDLQSGAMFWDPKETRYFLCDKEPRHHSIDEKEITNLIQEHLDCQEEYYAEDGFDDALEGCDDLISALMTTINQNLKKHNFYFTTEIQLLPND